MGLYDNIRETARQRGYTITQLEKELGFVRGKMAKMNDSSPSVETMQRIANKLSVPMDFLVNGPEGSFLMERADARDTNTDSLLERYYKLNVIGRAKALVAVDELARDPQYADFNDDLD